MLFFMQNIRVWVHNLVVSHLENNFVNTFRHDSLSKSPTFANLEFILEVTVQADVIQGHRVFKIRRGATAALFKS